MLDFHFWIAIAQVEHLGHTKYIKIRGCKFSIYTYYCIAYRLELKYFLFTHFLFNARCWLAGHQSGKKHEKFLVMQVSTWLTDVAFHLNGFLLQFLVVIDCNSCQRFFPSFSTLQSEAAVLFDWNLSRHPFLQVGNFIDLDLLLCTGVNSQHVGLFWNLIFTLRSLNI